ncbi:DUF4381 domain-containing protein [Albimonas sp. CAU 1670]|uniref:DUF4381 domain-containing protein n=1 Tax=Albimonas sp. CAU 1670 TaxID=3032599 RepID=UPI0023DB3B3A|nr:DUF4381 domain-containing protein [Albimonas sp. CAU 1670]MDF2233608.1 DUF4381 domain-containing protein [Albimonas sp. CAU 1670]
MAQTGTAPGSVATEAGPTPTSRNEAATAAPASAPPNLVDLLDELRQPPPPPPVSMLPQTAGWPVLGLLLLLALAFAVRSGRRRRRADAWRREALAALAQAGDDPAAVAPILRRAALTARPRQAVAGLSGERWLAFLDETAGAPPERSGGFAHGPGRALLHGPYDGRGASAPGLGALAARWVRRVKAEGAR